MRLNKIENTCSMMELGRLWNAVYSDEYDFDYYKTKFKRLLNNNLTFDNGVIICNSINNHTFINALLELGFRPKFKYEGMNDVTTYILHIRDRKPYKYNWFTRFFNNM